MKRKLRYKLLASLFVVALMFSSISVYASESSQSETDSSVERYYELKEANNGIASSYATLKNDTGTEYRIKVFGSEEKNLGNGLYEKEYAFAIDDDIELVSQGTRASGDTGTHTAWDSTGGFSGTIRLLYQYSGNNYLLTQVITSWAIHDGAISYSDLHLVYCCMNPAYSSQYACLTSVTSGATINTGFSHYVNKYEVSALGGQLACTLHRYGSSWNFSVETVLFNNYGIF